MKINFNIYVIILTLIIISCLCHEASTIEPLSSLPLSYYQERGMIPKRNENIKRHVEPRRATSVDVTYEKTITSADEYQIDLSQSSFVDNRGIILENVGDNDIINPWISINGDKNWFSISDMLEEILQNETDPKRRAFRIWIFLKENRYHWCPAETGYEIHSPPKFLNVYGYGFCDDSATNAEALFKSAGFQQARCWGLSGHVVPEVYYYYRWHMLDPDLQVFYPKRDNVVVASVGECAADGYLVRRVSGSSIENLYVTTQDNSTYENQWDNKYTMAMTLRPGEKLERYWYNWGKFHDIYMRQEPPLYGNGRLSYNPDLKNNLFLSRLSSYSNIETYQDSNQQPYVHILNDNPTGYLTCKMASPYVFVGGQITLDYTTQSSTDSISINYSTNLSNWKSVATLTGPSSGVFQKSLDDLIDTLHSSACYTFYIRITMMGSGRYSVGINAMQIDGDIQCAPRSLPGLEGGMINTVKVNLSNTDNVQLKITHNFREDISEFPPSKPARAIYPLNGDSIKTTIPELSWENAETSGTISNYEVRVSWSRYGVLVVSPPLWTEVGKLNSWKVTEGWLLDGNVYFWRVRACDNRGVWGPWSDPWSFYVQETGITDKWLFY